MFSSWLCKQDNEITELPTDMNEIGEELYWLAMRNNKLEVLPKCISGCAGLKQVSAVWFWKGGGQIHVCFLVCESC
jgi:hypothetical protein